MKNGDKATQAVIRELLDERNRLVEHYWKSKSSGPDAKRILRSIHRIESWIVDEASLAQIV